MDRLCQLEYLFEHLTLVDLFTAVHAGDGRLLVEHRELCVDLHQCGFYLRLQVLLTLVGYAINRSKNKAFIMLIRHGLLLADDEYGADDEQREQG